MQRAGEGGGELAHQRVFLGGPVVDQIAGEDHRIGTVGQGQHLVHHRPQPGHGILAVPVPTDVHIGELEQQEGSASHGARVSAAPVGPVGTSRARWALTAAPQVAN
jgi:hypothetical protein